MTDYVLFRENFQADTWEAAGRVYAESPEDAVKAVFGPVATIEAGDYVAVPLEEFLALFEGRPRVRITANVELEPAAVS